MIVIRIVEKFKKILSKKQKRQVFELGILMVIAGFAEMLSVSLMIPFMSVLMGSSSIESNSSYSFICKILHIQTEKTFLLVFAIFLATLYIFKNAFLVFQLNMQNKFIYNNMLETKSKLLHSFFSRPYEFFLGINSGEVIRIFNDDTHCTYELLNNLLSFFSESFVSITIVITLFFVSPLITGVISILMLIMIFMVGKIIRPRLNSLTKKNQIATADMTKWLLQAIQGIKEVKVMQRESFFENEFQKNGSVYANTSRQRITLLQIPRFMIEATSMSSVLLIIALLINFGSDMTSVVPVFAAIAVAAVRLLPSFNRISQGLNSLSAYEPYLDNTIENLKEVDNANSHLSSVEESVIPIRNEEYSLEAVCYRYPDRDKNVLNDININIKKGQKIGIIGLSGAGKTTLLDIMLGLLKPKSGVVKVDGVDLEQNKKEWLSHIAYIPQSIFLLDGSIRENVAFGIEESEIDDKRVGQAINEAALSDYVNSLPDGLDTQLGERGVRLSGGQRQRIGIARALYSNPDILFFDEATSALDVETEAEIMETIGNLKSDKTVIIVTHRLQTIADCDVIYSVKNGKIVNGRE